ncbi:YIP1 family protein [Roseobacter sp.]|uniref:YIP1 family protein n=1 Tax=Roseobacter sp. TaxID=1907202 RepID=UPI00385DE50D
MSLAIDWKQLAWLSLREPKTAAAQILSWKVERNTLWLLATVVIICTTIVSVISNYLVPVPDPYASLVAQPFRLFMIMAGVFLISVHMLFWVGRALGGKGDMNDLLSLLVWLQILRAGAQVVVVIAVLLSPVLAAFLVLFVLVATLWILLNFTSIGLQLESLSRAFVVCLVTLFAIVFAIALVGPMIGIGALGVPANV